MHRLQRGDGDSTGFTQAMEQAVLQAADADKTTVLLILLSDCLGPQGGSEDGLGAALRICKQLLTQEASVSRPSSHDLSSCAIIHAHVYYNRHRVQLVYRCCQQ